MTKETNKGTESADVKANTRESLSDAVEKAMTFVPQSINEATAHAVRNGSFVAQSNQIAMHSVDKMINLQGDVLRASFSDMQSLVEKQGQPPAELVNEAFTLMIDRSMEHVRTTLAATQEMHKAYLDLMEGYIQTMKSNDSAP